MMKNGTGVSFDLLIDEIYDNVDIKLILSLTIRLTNSNKNKYNFYLDLISKQEKY